MKKHTEVTNNTSRRNFTKTIAAALVVAPFASTLAKTKSNQRRRGATKRTLCPAPILSIRTDHIPPTDGSGGSFQLGLPHKLKQITDTAPPRPKNYVTDVPSDAEQYGELRILQVITEVREGFGVVEYQFGAGTDPRLLIWLQRTQKANPQNEKEENQFDPADLQLTDSHILIKGGYPYNSRQSLLLQIDRELMGREASNKKDRPHKYRYPNLDKNFHIGRWQVVDKNGNQIYDQNGNEIRASGDEGYRFLMAFLDPR
ncbi:MAG: hypothetical protein QOC96_2218 [Acidobacteriota bacterium]|jgi:hypothetical protein|nr:hypothetical protein [Acidobacteriota bacterium]